MSVLGRARPLRRWGLAVAAVLVTASACGTPPTSEAALSDGSPASGGTALASGAPGTALSALADIDIKGRAPRTGYEREQFGDGWVDTDHNGCDTRNDILARDLADETFKPGTHDCVVLTGLLADPYSGQAISFQRGQGTSEAVQIDHVVALSDAWQKGAQQWTAEQRTQFANDPLNLLAVDGSLNQQKSDGDAATWLPPNRAFRCTYVARQVAVKVAYGVWMTRAEHDAIASILGGCPDEPVPTASSLPPATPAGAAPPSTPPSTTPDSPAPLPVVPPTSPGAGYRNCAEVRAAGAAPIHVGDPGWSEKFDGDGDGIGCE